MNVSDMLDEFHRRPGADITAPDAPTLDVPGLLARGDYLAEELRELTDAIAPG